MARRLYSLAMVAAQPLLRRKLRRRGRTEPGYLRYVDERFGRYERPATPGAFWIHAVSLGETRAAAIVIEQLRRLVPGVRILLTHGTATGREEGGRIVRPGDMQAWLPWDTPTAVHAFLQHFKPAVGMLMETEVWPNLIAACHERGTPLALANARFSQKSFRQTQRLARLARPAYAALAGVWAQTQADAERLTQVGANVQHVFGNVKYDATPDAGQILRGREWRETSAKPVVMFASSREGEEAAFFRLVRDSRSVQWLVVPRHPQRFDEVAALAAQHGLSVSRRSTWQHAPQDAQVWIGDSLGEMAMYYGMADVALLGGSFEKLGGQNLIEAAACGCPVVMGPHTFNFSEAAELAQHAGAAFRVPDLEHGLDEALSLVADPARRDAAVKAALAFSSSNQGAARKTAEALLALVAT